VAFGVINNTRSTEYPEGEAMLVWKRLVSKYQSKSAPSRLALREEFNSSKLKNYKEDPDVWLTGLEDLRRRMLKAGSNMSETEFLEHVLNNLPREYENLVISFERRLDNMSNPLTIEEL